MEKNGRKKAKYQCLDRRNGRKDIHDSWIVHDSWIAGVCARSNCLLQQTSTSYCNRLID